MKKCAEAKTKLHHRNILNYQNIAVILIALSLVGCGVANGASPTALANNLQDVKTHPTPNSGEIIWPQDAVLLFDQPNSRINAGTLELYQNGSKDFQYDPFEVYVSPTAFQAYTQNH